MIAIQIPQYGDADVLSPVESPIPSPSKQQVLIQVAAAGVNRPDIMQRKGLYPPPAGASEIPGLEISGTIVKTGSQVSSLKNGDQVCALITGGGYAEYCLASAALCLPIPTGLDFVQAAALPENYFTVWSNVFDRAQLKAGENLLVHGGSSGIGTTAIQLANAFNSPVFITAGTDKKCHFCLELGAAEAINYNSHDYVETILLLTQKKGVNVILDMVGGDYFPRNLKCLSNDGRLVQIAIQKGAKSEINLWALMQKRFTITGSTLRARDDNFKAEIAKQLIQKVWPLLEAGRIMPVIDSTFPLSEAGAAHQRMERGLHMGKIILTI